MNQGYNNIFLKNDDASFKNIEKIDDNFTEICIFKAKNYLLFKSFKCDLLLEREDDEGFDEQFFEFTELFKLFMKGNNGIFFMIDIIETFLHIFEFNIDKEVLIEKLIHSIDESIKFNNLSEPIKKNCLINFLKGLLLSKLNT